MNTNPIKNIEVKPTTLTELVDCFNKQPIDQTKSLLADLIKNQLKEQGISPHCFVPAFNYYHY